MIEKILNKVGAPFKKGARFEKFYPAFEAIESFLLTPGHVTRSGPHIRDGIDLKRLMSIVVLALLPCTLFGIYNTGFQTLTAAGMEASFGACLLQGLSRFLPFYIITLAVGGTIEMIFAVIRKHEINEGFLVTSALFPLILPPSTPLWMVAVGIAFGVIIGKEVFGGTGMNVFNPALTGRCFMFFSFPASMSGNVWAAAPIKFTSSFPYFTEIPLADGFSGATPLATAYSGHGASYPLWDMFIGNIPGSLGETSALCALFGATVLIVTKVGSYKTIFGTVIGCLATALIFYVLCGNIESLADIYKLPPYYHLLMGGFAFGAVYMATDPVSGPATGTGKWIYGILIGMLVVLIRITNPAFPEGMMLAILFMNMFAPLIDHYVIESQIKRRLARA